MGKCNTAGFERYHVIYQLVWYIPGAGTVFASTSMVWENPTHGIPMFNPKMNKSHTGYPFSFSCYQIRLPFFNCF